MAGTSGSTCQTEPMQVSDSACATDGASSEYVTAPATATTSSSSFVSARSGSIEEQIERSKSHWSLLADQSGAIADDDDEDEVRPRGFWQKLMVCFGRGVAEVDNREVFRTAQMHPTWGRFFQMFGYGLGYGSIDKLVIGEKFAEGGQAELFHAQVKQRSPHMNKWYLDHGAEWVVKVFKKGTFFRHLQRQLPHAYLQFYIQNLERWKSLGVKSQLRYYCEVHMGTLLKEGRFAFLMQKEHVDLCDVIKWNMKSRCSEDCGLFWKEEAKYTMYLVALGVDWLHNYNRDLKALNVLVHENKSGSYPMWNCLVADFKCSIGVVGIGFFRVLKILRACKKQKLSRRLKVFLTAVDVYSYGMICYKVLMGKLPFEGHCTNEYNFVIDGQCLKVPTYV